MPCQGKNDTSNWGGSVSGSHFAQLVREAVRTMVGDSCMDTGFYIHCIGAFSQKNMGGNEVNY